VSAVVADRYNRPLTGRAITFVSQDTTVARVDAAGLVTARANGQTGVIVSSEGRADTVQVVVALPTNLRISAVTVTPADSLSEGGPVSVSVSITNPSTTAATAFSARLSILNAGTGVEVANSDTMLAVPGLAAGQTITITVESVVDPSMAWPDSARVRVQLDPANSILESDETDNRA
jgi:subtilase family serine protease